MMYTHNIYIAQFMVIEIGGNPCFFLHQVLGHPIFTQIQIEKGTNSFDPHQAKDFKSSSSQIECLFIIFSMNISDIL